MPTLHNYIISVGRVFAPLLVRETHPTKTMLKIAITGGAGSGKSVVARMFQELGAAAFDADARKAGLRRS